ncbi:uncharacterized protein LOC114939320 isoform X2 [Nylanderia fulva]|uniref:uncharacterized protein LOC114939320 isoform X2 n=1 Tax=Nylanderia fulva TaxID=613905 RepID=UPI0010FAEEF7|nr:uncharacterized protein LOC114939320 isoform X2 [Nylanderia fulva]
MFYIEEIKCLLTQFPQIDRNSFERYCNIEKSHYVKLSSIGNDLDRYREKPEREQLLEVTCTFVVQQIQLRKNVCYTNISASLDTIAQEVLIFLREKHPNHSIFSTSEETFSYWKTNSIEDNHWDETESTQIMDTLQEYIFGILNFRPCSYSRKVDLKSLCIDYVLQSKYGQHIIVFTIFSSVARRLGLRCDVIVFLTKISIFWKPKYVTNNLKNARCLYMTHEKFPNCLRNYLSANTLCRALAITITTTEMSLMIRSFVGEFIMEHEITALGLVQVKFNV